MCFPEVDIANDAVGSQRNRPYPAGGEGIPRVINRPFKRLSVIGAHPHLDQNHHAQHLRLGRACRLWGGRDSVAARAADNRTLP
jgi:hypothetical protein